MSIVISGTTGIDAGSLPVSNCGNTEVEGNLNLSGTGARITGDFSNSTLSNRLAFQTSSLNSTTTVNSLPNGTGVSSQFITHASSDASNSSRCGINVYANNVAKVFSDVTGTGTYLPMSFYTGGSERMRIDTSGNVVLTSETGALGYGTGAGGTVTQLTSKSTAVTLNKPTGMITMNNAALAAGASVVFSLSNTIIQAQDYLFTSMYYGTANPISYRVESWVNGTNSAYIRVTNITGGSLSETPTISFAVIKGAQV